MHTRLVPTQRTARAAVAVLAAGSILIGQQETSTTRILKSGQADQIIYLHNYIAEGMTADANDAYGLVLSNASLFVPILEQKIEEIVHSSPRERWFKSPSANPDRVIDLLAAMIEYTGAKVALEEASKLMKIDQQGFSSMVERCLGHADARGKGFQLAYRGLEIGDPAVDKRVMAWVEGELGASDEPNHTIDLRKWAEAMVEQYNGAPDEYQWAKDPIVSRLSADLLNPPGGTPLHDEMFRLIPEAAAKRPKK